MSGAKDRKEMSEMAGDEWKTRSKKVRDMAGILSGRRGRNNMS